MGGRLFLVELTGRLNGARIERCVGIGRSGVGVRGCGLGATLKGGDSAIIGRSGLTGGVFGAIII